MKKYEEDPWWSWSSVSSTMWFGVMQIDFSESGTFRIESLNHKKKIDISSSTMFNPKKKHNIHSDIRKFHSHQFLWNITSLGVKLRNFPGIRKAWRSLVHVKLPQSQNSDLQFLYILVGGWAYPSEKWWSEVSWDDYSIPNQYGKI